MVDRLSVHRGNDAEFVYDFGCLRHNFTDPGAGVALLMKSKR